MKAMVCLVSDQHVPNLMTVHAVKPDVLVLIATERFYSDPTQPDKAPAGDRKLLSALATGGIRFTPGENCHIIPLPTPEGRQTVSYEATIAALEKALQAVPGASKWVVNLTGGLKVMSLATADFFRSLKDSGRSPKIEFLYIEIGSARLADQLYADPRAEQMRLEHRLTIREYLQGYGYDIVQSASKIEKTDHRAIGWFEMACWLMRHINDKWVWATIEELDKWAALSKDTSLPNSDKGILLGDEGWQVPEPDWRKRLAEQFQLDERNGRLFGQLNKYANRFLQGGWLETFVFGVLKKCANELEINDLHVSLNIKSETNSVENDLDVAFITDDLNLYIIECKSGDQEHHDGRADDALQEALYKIEAVRQNFLALRATSVLAITKPDIKPSLERRARVYQAKFIRQETLLEWARLYNNQPTGPPPPALVDSVRKALGLR